MTGDQANGAARKGEVLIVDDNPENLKVLGDFLENQGYSVRVARDGQQALANAAAAPPEIILLDIHMPVMDGYETCSKLKANAALRDIPVIFLSALGETFNKVRGFECGGADYITKPFELEEVRVRIETHLQICRLLAESRAGFRASFEQAVVGMAHLDLDGTFLTINSRLRDMLGLATDDRPTLSLAGVALPSFRERVTAAFEAVRDTGLGQPPVDVQCQSADERVFWCRMTFSRVTVPSTGNRYVAAIIEDVSDQVFANDERRRLAAALEQAAEAIAITDEAGVTLYVNPAYERTFGHGADRFIGATLAILDRGGPAESPTAAIWETIASGGVWTGRVNQTGPEGKACTVEYTISPVRGDNGAIANFIAIARDMTRQIRLEEQLRQSQKMEAIGTLAAGIAHDFNNVLAGITGFTELTLDELPKDSPSRANLNEVLNASKHAVELVRQILAFGRQVPFEIKPVQMQRIVNDALRLLRRSIPPTIEIQCHLDESSSLVLADATAIHQIVMNLCTNAYHAMERTGGTLTVSMSEITVEEGHVQANPNLGPGRYVRLDVNDTGHGMDAATIQRIFEPYFTTKEREAGTGLGLATVHSIVTDFKGAIHVYSEPGNGSTFTVLLPVAEQAGSAGQDLAGAGRNTGTERVLFIDDDRAICAFAEKALSRLGYRPTTCTNPREALELFRGRPGDFDVIITDELMPELRGIDLLPELRAIRPDVPVILYSGYAERLRDKPRESFPFNAFVMKPLVVSELTKAIRSVLTEAKG